MPAWACGMIRTLRATMMITKSAKTTATIRAGLMLSIVVPPLLPLGPRSEAYLASRRAVGRALGQHRRSLAHAHARRHPDHVDDLDAGARGHEQPVVVGHAGRPVLGTDADLPGRLLVGDGDGHDAATADQRVHVR